MKKFALNPADVHAPLFSPIPLESGLNFVEGFLARAADGAGPVADSQPLGAKILTATDRAELAGRKKAADGN